MYRPRARRGILTTDAHLAALSLEYGAAICSYGTDFQVGLGTYEQESVAALNFLAGQRQIDRARLAVFGHSEGGMYALLLASGLAGPAPKFPGVTLVDPDRDSST